MRIAAIAVWCLASVVATTAAALDEGTVFDAITDYVAADIGCGAPSAVPGWERRIITSGDGYRLRYSRFGCAVGPRGALVISPGRSEPSYEYAETAFDFIARGFGPVYVIDHRGQGLSPRLLNDPDKGHVEDYQDFIDDFEVFVGAVEQDLADLGDAAETPIFVTSNSLGGAIVLGYLQKVGPDAPFDGAALLGTMIHVNYLSFTGRDPSWLNLRIYSETGAMAQAFWRCTIAPLWAPDRCTDYAAPATFGPYLSETRHFSPDVELLMTHSKDRFDLRTHFWGAVDWEDMAAADYDDDEIWTGPQLGGSTNGWVLEAVRMNRDIRRPDNLAKSVSVPVLLLTGTQDLRAYRPYVSWLGRPPDLSRHADFCDALNRESLRATGDYICNFIPVNGGFHELYKERDAERDLVLDTVDWFFARHGQ